ncbi:zinc-ribbon domain-containing protein [Faecalibacterium prausnitzii]|uniref:zinc-ribbon domain-containing protein n=1 Tax=Faecalibacterium prausnitzii TaxID=853 RepID=UPI001CBFEFCC
MFCENCGHQISDTAKFCSACGHPVGTAPSPGTVAPPAVPAKRESPRLKPRLAMAASHECPEHAGNRGCSVCQSLTLTQVLQL